MQAIRELIKNDDVRSKEHTLAAISLVHPQSVEVAKKLVENGYIQQVIDSGEDYSNIFDKVVEELERVV